MKKSKLFEKVKKKHNKSKTLNEIQKVIISNVDSKNKYSKICKKTNITKDNFLFNLYLIERKILENNLNKEKYRFKIGYKKEYVVCFDIIHSKEKVDLITYNIVNEKKTALKDFKKLYDAINHNSVNETLSMLL